jgi:hypothetical protein
LCRSSMTGPMFPLLLIVSSWIDARLGESGLSRILHKAMLKKVMMAEILLLVLVLASSGMVGRGGAVAACSAAGQRGLLSLNAVGIGFGTGTLVWAGASGALLGLAASVWVG